MGRGWGGSFYGEILTASFSRGPTPYRPASSTQHPLRPLDQLIAAARLVLTIRVEALLK